MSEPELHGAVARAIADDRLGHTEATRPPSADDYAAAAVAIRVVREYIATEEVPGMIGRTQRRERARVLAEAAQSIEDAFSYKATSGDKAAWWARQRALAALAALGERPVKTDEPMIGGPHEITNQYHSEPSRDPRQR